MTDSMHGARRRRDEDDPRPHEGRGVGLARYGDGVHGLPAVLAGRRHRLQQDLLPQRQPGDRPDRGDGDLRRRLRRPPRRRDLLRPDGRPDRPQEGPVPHDRPDGRLDHPHRRAADLRHDRHRRADPARRAAAGPGLRGRRGDRRRDRDAGRVRAGEAPRRDRLAGVARDELGHAGRVGAVGVAARCAVRGAAAQLGLAPAVPAELRPADLRGVAAAEPQGEPGLRGAPGRRRRRRAVPRRGRDRGCRDARERPGGRSEAAQGQGVLPRARVCGSARRATPGSCRPSSSATSPPTLLVEPVRADAGDRVGLAARLRHRPGGRHARRPLRSAPGLHRADPADHGVRLPDAAADHQRQHAVHSCSPWSSA